MLPPLALGNHWSVLSINLPFPCISYKWNNRICSHLHMTYNVWGYFIYKARFINSVLLIAKLCVCIHIYHTSFIHLLKDDTFGYFHLGPSQMMLLWILTYMSLCGPVFSFLFYRFPGVEMLGHMVNLKHLFFYPAFLKPSI